MGILWGKFVTWLGASILTIWIGYRAFWTVGFLAFLAVGLYGLFLYGLEDVLTYLLGRLQNTNVPSSAPTLSGFTGLAGWLLTVFRVPECIAFVIDIILLKFTLRKIPFIKW